ncbi:fibronectin type III domain-containing protein [Amycolatopsis benzoatilytica]|uniref:fibronectin type III domain-containing protein n=1 Tax=Amycolatopsis benzoatilytica TaxID=346045 RepID=UPI00035D90E2|nr:fibronectin type III domain-containing protein [Amycolatopsis benzoatilytica]
MKLRRPSRPGGRRAFGLAVAALTATALLPAGVAAAWPGSQDVYVSPWGNDFGSGAVWSPVRTLPRAQQLVRQRAAHLNADLTVHVASGTYRLDQPLVLDASDSGSPGHRVIWQGSPGTVVSGGKQVTGWRPVAGRPGLYSAPAPAGLDNTRQLYVDGARAQRASGRLPVTVKATETGYTASSDALAHWRNPSDLELVYTGGEGLWNVGRSGLGQWTEPRCPIASAQGTTITMAQPCWDNSTKRLMFADIPGRSVNMVGPGDLTNGRQPSYVENAFELLDTPGEWYLDRSARRVYYLPRKGENLNRADVELPALEKLVDGRGTAEKPIHDISFRGIQFSYATWLGPSSPEGFSEIQAGYQITGERGWATQGLCQFTPGGACPYADWTKEPGNVSISHGQRVEFSDSVFAHLGGAGLDLGEGAQDSTVSDSVFTDISGNGVEIGGVSKPNAGGADVTARVKVTNNHLYGMPREFTGGVPIVNGYSQSNVISHNQIDHVAYSGISMGWGGWPDKIKQAATANVSRDNVVSNNLIHDYMLSLDDGGGIYTQGITGPSQADGEKVTGNVIHDQWGLGKSVYTDNGCTYETVSGNVLYNAAYANVASTHVDYRDSLGNNDPTVISGNYWEQGDPDGNIKGVLTQGNHLLSNPAAAPKSIVDNAGIEPSHRGVLSRRVDGGSAPQAPTRIGTFAVSGALYVTWNPTVAENGAPVKDYLLTASDGKQTVTSTVSAKDFKRTGYTMIPGLTDGKSYTVTVAARNVFGTGMPSLPSAAVTVAQPGSTPAGVVTKTKALPSSDAVSLHWAPPAENGSAPVISYRITVSDGRTIEATGRDTIVSQPTQKGMTRVVDGLKPGTAYTFTIAPVTGIGVGPAVTVQTTTVTG